MEAKEGGTVTIGDNGKGHILGIGKIGTSSTCIENVLYVDGLMHNLLSISQLCYKGFQIVFEANACKVVDDQSIFYLNFAMVFGIFI